MGGKWGWLGLWDINDAESQANGVHLFRVVKALINLSFACFKEIYLQPHSRPINCLSFDRFHSSKLVSTSYDGTIRCFDLQAQKVELLMGFEEKDNICTTYHKQLDQNVFLFSMGKTGKVGVADKRVSNLTPAREIRLFSQSSVKTVDIHPLKRDIFLCPNNRGQCCTYDLRISGDSKDKGILTPLMQLQGHSKVS